MTAGLVVTSPPAHADTTPPPSPPPAPVVVTGETVQIQATPVAPQPPPSAPGLSNPNPGPTKPVEVQNSAPKVETVAAYTLRDVPGTFTHKVTFPPINPVAEQRVLAADTTGKAVAPSQVRIAYRDKNQQLWVFFPEPGKLERVGSWPAVYPGVPPPGRAIPTLTTLFNGAPGGEEWLEKARVIAVVIAAAVITGGAVAVFGIVPALQAVAMAVPLSW
ncbi:hypothetical protein [Mycobacterium palustre]|uniref:hypothetical protein n=1 Tax=Mycobacterium palustre TaxID=153971 RepID=UPI00115077A1|nr:hypothetical protein [Mycobacterium palustre]MCV7101582.1 hypothetical protein [Mycobacterium palustre]